MTNENGTGQAAVTVSVGSSTIRPEYYRYSVRHEKGAPAFFPLMTVGSEIVNSANGNLFFTVPLVSRPGRNGMGVDLKLSYNSKFWDHFVSGGTLYAHRR